MLFIIKPFSKRNGLQGWYIAGSISPPTKNLQTEKCYTDELDCHSVYKYIIKEMGPKVGCFAGFCQHCLTTMSAHMHEYRYLLFESGAKTGFT